MAYSIKFGNLSKRQNSTKRPDYSNWVNFDVNLKKPTSLETPVVTLSAESFNYNYAVFQNKYYFVSDIVAVRNDLYEVTLSLDPMATYKDEILSSTQFVSYSSVSGDSWLPDTRIPVLRSTIVNSASAGIAVWAGGSVSSGFYILSYIGLEGAGLVAVDLGTLQAIISSISDLDDEVDAIVNYPGYDWTVSAEQNLYYLARVQTQNDILGKAYGQAPSCLRSCIWVPFAVSGSGHVPIWLGNYDTGQTGILVSAFPRTGSVSVTIPWHYTDWRRGYCEQVYLYLPLVGMIGLSSDNLTHTNSITVHYSYTVTDGTISYQVESGGEIIGTYGGSCAINYPLGVNQQASAGEVTNAIMQGLANTVSAGITGNVAGVIAGIAATSYSALDVALTSHPSCVGGIGGGSGSGLPRDVVCFTVAHDTNVQPGEMAATMGVPTMKPLVLSNCSGYCQCANAHVSLDAPLPEINAVDTYLNSGFFIE